MYMTLILTDANEGLLYGLPQEEQIELLYLLSLTAEFATDQLGLWEDHRLWKSLSIAASNDIQNLMEVQQKCLRQLLEDAGKLADLPQQQDYSTGALLTTRGLMLKLYEESSDLSPTGYYAARVLSKMMNQLNSKNEILHEIEEEWLSKLDGLKSSTENILGALALLTGLTNLATNRIVSNLCNRLVSDVAAASAAPEKTIPLLVLLNACFAIYDHDLPVAQNRLVFAVKQILSCATDGGDMNSTQMSTEMLRALQRLLPAIENVYGPYWTRAVEFSLVTSDRFGKMKAICVNPPALHASLKLFAVLETLDDSNDDREEALEMYGPQISAALLVALKQPGTDETPPLRVLNELISRLVVKIPDEHIGELSELYPLIASESSSIQTAAYDLLHRALPAAQQQISVDVLLENKDATISEELLSLLMEPPSIARYDDSELHQFPSSIRSYLFTWHLIFDCFSTASLKVRADYITSLKSDNFTEPFLDFIFDVLINSESNPLSLIKTRFDKSSLRTYDTTRAEDDEHNMHSLMVYLWFQTLKYTPSLGKTWWVDCKSKSARRTVEAYTEKYISSPIIEDALAEVTIWAEEQEPDDEGKTLEVKTSKKSREVVAGYDIDEMQIQLAIKFPSTYPLLGAQVEGLNRVAVSEAKWRGWLMVVQGVITFSNGSVIDGLMVFRNNITGTLKGQTECAICYSIVSSDKKMPEKKCGTCKNLFHAGCLLKWFSTSNQSSCPLCRNQFTFAVDPPRRQRGMNDGPG